MAPWLHGRSMAGVHAGIYYKPGSLKARLCVEGSRALYAYCDERGLPYRKAGKLIVATAERELAGLDELARRGRANGVPELRRLAGDEIGEIEPAARGLAGLHSPQTGIVDFKRVADSYAADVIAGGGTVHLGAEVARVAHPAGAIELLHSRGSTRASAAVFCAGLWADRLAVACGAPADPASSPSAVAISRSSGMRRRRCGRTSTRCPIPSCRSSAPT